MKKEKRNNEESESIVKSETKLVGIKLGSNFLSLTKELQYKISIFILASVFIALGLLIFIILGSSSGFFLALVFGVIYVIFLVWILRKIYNKYLPTEK